MLNALINASEEDHAEMEKQEFLANRLMQERMHERNERKRTMVLLDE